jgi:hypothetical protein
MESSPRTTTAMIAVLGRPTSRTAAPAIAWSGATTKSRRSSGLDSPTSIGASCVRGAGDNSCRRAATRSSVVPWRIADTTTTKNTALKMVLAVPTSDERTNVARTIGTAPRRPAQPSRSFSRELKSLNAVDTQTATGRTRNTSRSASATPEAATSSSCRGKTSRPRTMNIATCARNAMPSWKPTSCRR